MDNLLDLYGYGINCIIKHVFGSVKCYSFILNHELIDDIADKKEFRLRNFLSLLCKLLPKRVQLLLAIYKARECASQAERIFYIIGQTFLLYKKHPITFHDRMP